MVTSNAVPSRCHHLGRLIFVAAVIALLGPLTTISGLATAADSAESLPAFRRVVLNPEQAAAEADRVRRGELTQMSSAEFDELFDRAVKAAAGHRKPRLAATHYRAKLDGQALTGTGEWTIVHPGSKPEVLSVDPIRIALTKVHWSDGAAAVFGDINRIPSIPGVELLVDRSGQRKLDFLWSARGVLDPGGLRFDLRLPPCAVAVLELDLPADREPVVRRDVGLLSGPTPAEARDRRLWKLAFSGTTRIDMSVRPLQAASGESLLLSRQQNRQEIVPGRTICDFVIDLESPQAAIRELQLECDAKLQIEQISIRDSSEWKVLPEIQEGKKRIEIHLREPMLKKQLTVRAVMPSPIDGSWGSPEMRVVGAVTRGETLSIRVHPTIRLMDWGAGALRLLESAVDAEHWHNLSLRTDIIPIGIGRPTAKLKYDDRDVQVHEQLWWSVGPERMALSARLEYKVLHGRLPHARLQLPADWEFDHVESGTAGLIKSASIVAAPATPIRRLLHVEFSNPIGVGDPAQFTVHLIRRNVRPDSKSEWVQPFPDIVPDGVRRREGWLAIQVAAGIESLARCDSPTATIEGPPAVAAPWVAKPADYAYQLMAWPNRGSLRLWPRPARLAARAELICAATPPRFKISNSLTLDADAPGPSHVLIIANCRSSLRDWRVVKGDNAVKSVQRFDAELLRSLSSLGAAGSLQAIVTAGLQGGTESAWLVQFAKPLSQPIELWSEAEVVIDESSSHFSHPLLRVAEATSEDYRVTVDVRAAPSWRVMPVHLRSILGSRESPRFRTFRYAADGALAITRSDEHSPEAVVDRAQWTTFATDASRLIHRISFRVWNWDQPDIAVDLPLNAALRQTRINGIIVRPQTQFSSSSMQIRIPVIAESRSLSIDVVYTTPGQLSGFLTRIDAQPPRLPANSPPIQRLWCLPPDAMPLRGADWQRWTSNTVVERRSGQSVSESVSLALTNADRWSEAIRLWALEQSPGETAVVDTWALNVANIDADRRDSRANWDAAGLCTIAGNGFIVLTSKVHSQGLPPSWESSIVQAMHNGFDASGRFRRALDWAVTSVDPCEGLLPVDVTHGDYWELINPSDAGAYWAVRPAYAGVIGCALSTIAFGLAWFIAMRSSRWSWVSLLLWFALATVAVIWLPESLKSIGRWPMFVALALILWRVVPKPSRNQSVTVLAEPNTVAARFGAAGLLAVGLIGTTGQSQGPAQTSVFVVPATQGAAEVVLAPTELVMRLRAIADPDRIELNGCVWLESRYQGQVAGTEAHVSAFLTLHSFTDDPPPLTVPLTGIQLQEAKLDGKPAFLRAVGDQYQLKVSGRGVHKLEVTFAAPILTNGETRDMRFGVPESPITHLSLSMPSNVLQENSPTGLGAQERGTTNGQRTLQADLGHVGTLTARWRVDDARARTAIVRSQQVYLWDLSESAAELNASVRYSIGSGTVDTLAVEIPSDLVVTSASARPADATGTATGWLQSWQMDPAQPGHRANLKLQFSTPIAGNWLINLSISPRNPLTLPLSLSFPTIPGPQIAPPVMAWRAQRIAATDMQPSAVAEIAPDAFLKDYWLPLRMEADPRVPTKAYQRVNAGALPNLRLRAAIPPRPTTSAEIVWHIGATRADVEVNTRVASSDGALSLVEWDVPSPIEIVDVGGPDVLSWSASGSRLQIWLSRPVTETIITWFGRMSRTSEFGRFDVPRIRPHRGLAQGSVRVRASQTMALSAIPNGIVKPSATAESNGREWVYSIGQAQQRVAFQVRPLAGFADFRVHTHLTSDIEFVSARAEIQAEIQRGELWGFNFYVRRSKGWQFQFESPPGARVRELPGNSDAKCWRVELQNSATRSFRMSLIGRRPNSDPNRFDVPDVGLLLDDRRSRVVERTISDPGATLKPGQIVGLRAMPERNAWRVIEENWRLSTVMQSPPNSAPLLVELTEVEAARADDGRWLRRATMWIAQNRSTNLRVNWPDEKRIVAVTVDGLKMTPPSDAAGEVDIPLLAGLGIRKVQLIWTDLYGFGLPHAPELPLLFSNADAVPSGPVLWKVIAQTSATPESATASLTPSAESLHRAAAFIRLAESVAATDFEHAKIARSRAALALRQADAAVTGADETAYAPDGRTLTVWRNDLRYALRRSGGALPAGPDEVELPYSAAFARGTPTVWYIRTGSEAPQLDWPVTPAPWRMRLLHSLGLMVIAMVAFWWGRRLRANAWPEFLVLIGMGAWIADGGVIWLIPAVFGAATRIAGLARDAWRWRRNRRTVHESSSAQL